jgi:hypothetical protein
MLGISGAESVSVSSHHVRWASDVHDTAPDTLKDAVKIAKKGNKFRDKDDFGSALERYSRAISKLEREFGKVPADSSARLLLAKVYALRSKVYSWSKDIHSAVSDGGNAEKLEPSKLRFFPLGNDAAESL